MRLRLIFLGTMASALALGAESPEYSLVALFYTGLKEVDLQALHLDARDLEFEAEEVILGFDADLNGDGMPDHLLRGSCGNAGCTLRVIDGKTNKHIATLAGRPLIVHSARINSWPVLSVYHHWAASEGTFTTYVYDGQRYEQISSLRLYEQAISDLDKKLESVPSIGRPKGETVPISIEVSRDVHVYAQDPTLGDMAKHELGSLYSNQDFLISAGQRFRVTGLLAGGICRIDFRGKSYDIYACPWMNGFPDPPADIFKTVESGSSK